MSEQVLLCEHVQKGIALLTLNRPEKKNALSKSLRDELSRQLDTLALDESVECVVLTGAGEDFCAGFDLKELATGHPETIFIEAQQYHVNVYNFKKPLVAAINGAALAGGMDLAAMCDIRIASNNATFGQPQVRAGIPAAYNLMRTVLSEAQARYLCLTGARVSAEEALKAEFLIDVVAPHELSSKAIQLAGVIADTSIGPNMKRSFRDLSPLLFV